MADRKETILLQLELDVNKLTANLQKVIEDFTILSGRQKDLKKQMEELRATGQESGATFQNLSKEYAENGVRLKELRAEQSSYEKQIRLVNTASKEQEGSISQLRAQLALATVEYNKLSEQERESSNRGKELTASIKGISDKLKEQEGAIGDARRNVGNYAEAVKSAFAQLNLSKDKVNDLKLQIQQLNDKFDEGKTDQAAFNEQLSQLTSELKISTEESGKLQQKMDELKTIAEAGAEQFKSLRQRLKEAKDEATLMQDKFQQGLIDEKTLISAQQKVANLSEEMGDFNKRVEALNPEAKFKAFTQVAAGLAGAFSAAQGGMALFGAESEETQKALLKVQAAMAFASGLNQVAELGDAFKNLKIVLGLSTVATQAQTIAQGENAVVTEANAVAQGELAAGEVVATGTTGALTVAMTLLTGPLGLVVIGIAAVVAAFKIYGAITDQAIEKTESLVNASDASLETAKHTVEVRSEGIKKEQDAIEQKLELLKAEGKGESDLLDFKIRSNATLQNFQDDAIEANKNSIAELSDLEQRSINASRKAKSDDEKKQLEDKAKSLADQIKIIEKANEQILSEQQKADSDLQIQQINLAEKQKQIAEQATSIRIGLIKDEQQKEIAAEIESNKEKIRQLQKAEGDNAALIEATNAASTQKIIDINLKFAQQEAQEVSQIQINATREGTEARLNAEASAAIRIRDARLQDEKLTTNQRLIIEQEASNKLREIDDARLALIEKNNQQEVDLAIRTAQAKIAIRRSEAGNNPDDQLQISLDEINQATQAKIDAKEREGDALKEQAQREITDAEELKQRILEIDSTIAIEKVAILKQSSEDIRQETISHSDFLLQNEIELNRLLIEAANPNQRLDLTLKLNDLEEEADKKHAIETISNQEKLQIVLDAITEKHAKIRNGIKDAELNANLNATAKILDAQASLIKKETLAYKIFATASAIIATYAGAAQALADETVVNTYVKIANAAAVIANGLNQVARINNVQFKQGGFSDQGGHTGSGDANSVSTAVGLKPYTYHKKEYIVPDPVLSTPEGRWHVDRLEAMRRNSTSLRERRWDSSLSAPRSFAVGGFSDSIVVNNSPINIDVRSLTDAVESLPSRIPQQVLVVEDVTGLQGQQVKVSERANF